MFKSTLAAVAASATLFSGAAIAGPYVNVETNSGFDGGEYGSTLLETHIGYESSISDNADWYIQGGPANEIGTADNAPTELSGKIGASVAISESSSIYGELALATTNEMEFDNLNAGVKLGVKIGL